MTQTNHQTNKECILIVDDNSTNLKVLHDYLAIYGFEIMTAQSAERALKLLKRQQPDIILLDVMMPGMDGFDFCRQLKADPEVNEIPVIFMTALSDTESKIKGFEAGGVDYVTKPIHQAEIKARVMIQLTLRQQQKKLAAQNQELLYLNSALKLEQEKSEKLLLNILPAKIVEDLKQFGKATPERFENVSVCFSDLVGFTIISQQLSPETLIGELNDLYTGFDEVMVRYGCERIETVGDAYLAVCGMPDPNPDHAVQMIHASLGIIRFIHQRNADVGKESGGKAQWRVRIGVHSGPVVGGVVGTRRYSYNVFGDTINTASRLQTHADPMRVNISESTYKLVRKHFACSKRPLIEVKGKGEMMMYYVEDDAVGY